MSWGWYKVIPQAHWSKRPKPGWRKPERDFAMKLNSRLNSRMGYKNSFCVWNEHGHERVFFFRALWEKERNVCVQMQKGECCCSPGIRKPRDLNWTNRAPSAAWDLWAEMSPLPRSTDVPAHACDCMLSKYERTALWQISVYSDQATQGTLASGRPRRPRILCKPRSRCLSPLCLLIPSDLTKVVLDPLRICVCFAEEGEQVKQNNDSPFSSLLFFF